MSQYLLGAGVNADLESAYRYIAQHNLRAAEQFYEVLFDRFRVLARNPQIGELRDDLYPGTRKLSVGNYVVLFRAIDDGVEIIQVVHAARDLDAVFRIPGPAQE